MSTDANLTDAVTTDPGDTAPRDANRDAAPTPSNQAAPVRRERSTVRFPYFDLDDAVTIARKLHDLRGGRCDLATLAADLNHDNVQSGSFRLRLSAASMYGLVSQEKGQVSLTALGGQIVDPHTEAAARSAAFLNVELYGKVYEEFKNGMLPQPAGLEDLMGRLGVTANQVSRARQIFTRAATQAGFLKDGANRLVLPPTGTLGDTTQNGSSGDAPPSDEGAPKKENALSNPLLSALMNLLPAEGEPFSAKERRRFFRALAVNIDVIYGEPDDGQLDAETVAALFRLDSRSQTAVTADHG